MVVTASQKPEYPISFTPDMNGEISFSSADRKDY